MALLRCGECGRAVSDRAAFCPACGWPLREVLQSLEGQGVRVTLRFNPLARTGWFGWMVGLAIMAVGWVLLERPDLLDDHFAVLGKSYRLEPLGFFLAGALLWVRGVWRGFFWGCTGCGGALGGRKRERCPFCHRRVEHGPADA
ncbi:MAG: zinc ribbon domain-containing protein [Magnetococcales bacterium]|nr:zinc ribbon domain-containing protein [Magnetococcales bacterium]